MGGKREEEVMTINPLPSSLPSPIPILTCSFPRLRRVNVARKPRFDSSDDGVAQMRRGWKDEKAAKIDISLHVAMCNSTLTLNRPKLAF